jgi:hypothetical protein
MSHLADRDCAILHRQGVKPDTDLKWVCVYPSHPMYQPWTPAQVEAAGLTGANFNLVPVYTQRLYHEPETQAESRNQ